MRRQLVEGQNIDPELFLFARPDRSEYVAAFNREVYVEVGVGGCVVQEGSEQVNARNFFVGGGNSIGKPRGRRASGVRAFNRRVSFDFVRAS